MTALCVVLRSSETATRETCKLQPKSINQSINQSSLFQAARPIERKSNNIEIIKKYFTVCDSPKPIQNCEILGQQNVALKWTYRLNSTTTYWICPQSTSTHDLISVCLTCLDSWRYSSKHLIFESIRWSADDANHYNSGIISK